MLLPFHGVAAFGGAMCALQDRPRMLRQDYSQKRHRNRKGKAVNAQNAAGGLPAALACGKALARWLTFAIPRSLALIWPYKANSPKKKASKNPLEGCAHSKTLCAARAFLYGLPAALKAQRNHRTFKKQRQPLLNNLTPQAIGLRRIVSLYRNQPLARNGIGHCYANLKNSVVADLFDAYG